MPYIYNSSSAFIYIYRCCVYVYVHIPSKCPNRVSTAKLAPHNSIPSLVCVCLCVYTLSSIDCQTVFQVFVRLQLSKVSIAPTSFRVHTQSLTKNILEWIIIFFSFCSFELLQYISRHYIIYFPLYIISLFTRITLKLNQRTL